MEKDNFFYKNDKGQFSYIQIPYELITNKKYERTSAEAKILYGILLSRLNLSYKNNWVDEDNRVYIIITIEKIQEKLNLATATAVKRLKELEELDLLYKKRQGQGKPNLIYLKKLKYDKE